MLEKLEDFIEENKWSILNLDMNQDFYLDWYHKIIDMAKETRPLSDKKSRTTYGIPLERHHILPRCLSGPDTDDNLVYLTSLEHTFVHSILALAYPENKGIVISAILMTGRTNALCFLPSDFIKFSERLKKKLNYPVVGYKEDYTVVRIYKEITDIPLNDDLSYYPVSRVLKKKEGKVYGCYWNNLLEFQKLHQDKIDEFLRNPNTEKLKKGKGNPYVAYKTDFSEILWFDSQLSAKEYINSTTLPEGEFVGGYMWKKEINFINEYPSLKNKWKKI